MILIFMGRSGSFKIILVLILQAEKRYLCHRHTISHPQHKALTQPWVSCQLLPTNYFVRDGKR